MSIKSLVIGVGISLMIGCSFSSRVQLYPIQGPLSTQRPLPVIVGEKTGLTSGTFSLVLPNGEKCNGPWSLVIPLPNPNGGSSVEAIPERDLSSVWDSIYGAGFYVANVIGARQYGRSKLVGDHGAVVFLEMYCNEGANSPVLGVAQDNSGNTYKLSFPQAVLNGSNLESRPTTDSTSQNNSPRLIIPATGGAPVVCIPIGGNLVSHGLGCVTSVES
jgi:hypothetical protein